MKPKPTVHTNRVGVQESICKNAKMSNNSSRVESAQGERAAGTCQSALYPLPLAKDGHRSHCTRILARLYQRYSETVTRLPNPCGGASTPPKLFQVLEGKHEKS